MRHLITRIFGTKEGRMGLGRRGGNRPRRPITPEVLSLEGRQLLSGGAAINGVGHTSAFSREFFGPGANDMAVYRPSNGTWYIATPASGFSTNPQAPPGSQPLQYQWGTRGDIPIQNTDFLGTGHADLAVFRPSSGTWYIKDPITGGTLTVPWGQAGDVPLAHSDFFGNGHADLAVFRPSNGTWYIKDPINGRTLTVQWGQAGDVPIAGADFDGDGKTDIAVFRPSTSTWFVLQSSTGYDSNRRIQVQWGQAGDVPIMNSDFDGDGKTDIAVWRPSTGTWFVLKSSTGYDYNRRIQVQWGQAGDVPLASSDFDGDGKADLAVFRPSTGTWFVLQSSTGYDSNRRIQVQWGEQGDLPLANMDFDGDGRADIAVFRPMDGTWHVLTSSSNFTARIERGWGVPGDEAIGGPDAPDPVANIRAAGSEYASFLGDPVFASDGPKPEDVTQGGVGDCQTLAALIGIAKDDPGLLLRSIADMGNGTYAVDFRPLGIDRYVIVDATLPVWGDGTPVYAKLGHQNSLWVALMEEAWTFQRPTGGSWNTAYYGTYTNIEGGGSGEVLGALGLNAHGADVRTSTADALWDDAVTATFFGQVATVSTGLAPAITLLGSHQYFVDALNYAWNGTTWAAVSMRLQDPHGGFITISKLTFEQSMVSATWAYV